MTELLKQYGKLLSEVDIWFSRSMDRYPEHILCGKGCSGCCRGLFDITLLDACYLQRGFNLLPLDIRINVSRIAKERVDSIRKLWPEFDQPYLLNHRSEDDWQQIMPEDDETPCLLLDDSGNCLIYEYRPMTCRLHGLPLVDISGEVMHDEWCTENFRKVDPLQLEGLRAEFERMLQEEVRLDRMMSIELFGTVIFELDTLIPAAMLINFKNLRNQRVIENLDSLP